MANNFQWRMSPLLRGCSEAPLHTAQYLFGIDQTYTYITFDELAEENWVVAGKMPDEQ